MKLNTKIERFVVGLSIMAFVILAGCQGGGGGGGNSDNDDNAPTVETIEPADNADNVAPDREITITFSTDMDGTTITQDSVKLYHQSGTEIAGSVSSSGEEATLTPEQYLEHDVDYTIEIKDSIKDLQGSPLDQDYTSSFTAKFHAGDEETYTYPNRSKTIDLSTNMSTQNGVSYEIITDPGHGTASISGRQVTYDPTSDYQGEDSLVVRANNGVSDSTQATLSITVRYFMFSDTDQTADTTNTFGEDSDYTIHTQSYSWGDASHDTLTDNVTGLLWQQGVNGVKQWADASADCQGLELGGYDDWRLPAIKELFGITLWDDSSNKFDASFDDSYDDYWSQSTADSDRYYYVTVDKTISSHSANSYNSRCVRGSIRENQFEDSSNGTVMDEATGLTWQQGEGGQKYWEDALAYCEGLTLASKSDWRLPNIKELVSIVDFSASTSPMIDTTFFPDAVSGNYWSSTTDSSESSAPNADFSHGNTGASSKTVYEYNVRCVRGGTD